MEEGAASERRVAQRRVPAVTRTLSLAPPGTATSPPPTPGRNRDEPGRAQEVVQHTSGPWSYIKDGADETEVVERLKVEIQSGNDDRRDVVGCLSATHSDA